MFLCSLSQSQEEPRILVGHLFRRIPFSCCVVLPPPAAISPPPSRRNLTNNQRQAILHRLLPHQKQYGKLANGAYKNAAEAFKVSPRTFAKIWK